MSGPDRDGARSVRARARSLVFDGADRSLRGVVPLLRRLCLGAVSELPVFGAAVNLMPGGGDQSLVAASDARTRELVEIQFTTGEGPCHDAFATRRPVLLADLVATSPSTWPGYAALAREAGVRSVAAFPLQVGAVGLGVLDLFGDRPGALTGPDLDLALELAVVATDVLLDGGMRDGHLDDRLDGTLDFRAEIHQAQGMVMVQLGVPIAEALVRMRAHAFGADQPLVELAREIVGGRMLLERDG